MRDAISIARANADNIIRFETLCRDVQRDGMRELLEWLRGTDYFTAPASTRFHGAYSGGLLQHSLNVYDELVRLLKVYPEVIIDKDSVIIASLFHDLCKVNSYGVEQRNRKNKDGQWEKYDVYVRKESFCFGGHGSKSVYLVQKFMKLTDEEAVAINCHMSAFDGDMSNVGSAFSQYPFAWLLSVADQSATYVIESEED